MKIRRVFTPSEYGQRWAIAMAPSFRRESGGAVRKIVYCHTNTAEFKSSVWPDGWCRRYRTIPTWEKCSTCTHSQGFGSNKFFSGKQYTQFLKRARIRVKR